MTVGATVGIGVRVGATVGIGVKVGAIVGMGADETVGVDSGSVVGVEAGVGSAPHAAAESSKLIANTAIDRLQRNVLDKLPVRSILISLHCFHNR